MVIVFFLFSGLAGDTNIFKVRFQSFAVILICK